MSGRRPLTKEMYEVLVSAFEEKPGNASHAADVLGCDRRMARRLWHKGYTSTGFTWARPIKLVLEERQEAARVRLVAEEAERAKSIPIERAKLEVVTKDAVGSHAEEARIVRAARQNATSLLAATLRMAPGVQAMAERVNAALQQKQLSPGEATILLDRISRTISQGITAAKVCMEMERQHLGEPERVIGFQHQLSVERATAVVGGNEELLKKATEDLLAGRMTPEAQALLLEQQALMGEGGTLQ